MVKAFMYLLVIFLIFALAAVELATGNKVIGILLIVVDVFVIYPITMDDLNR